MILLGDNLIFRICTSFRCLVIVFMLFGGMGLALGSVAGSSAPGFKGINLLSEKDIVTTQPKSKGVVFVFMSARCPCSNSHMREINSLAETFGESLSFYVVHSNQDESETQARKYFGGLMMKVPVLVDSGARFADELQAFKTPHAYIFSADGKKLYEGGVSDTVEFERAKVKYLRRALEQLAAGEEIKPSLTRTLGCVISRR